MADFGVYVLITSNHWYEVDQLDKLTYSLKVFFIRQLSATSEAGAKNK